MGTIHNKSPSVSESANCRAKKPHQRIKNNQPSRHPRTPQALGIDIRGWMGYVDSEEIERMRHRPSGSASVIPGDIPLIGRETAGPFFTSSRGPPAFMRPVVCGNCAERRLDLISGALLGNCVNLQQDGGRRQLSPRPEKGKGVEPVRNGVSQDSYFVR
ncbi:hypothetical protein J6590_026990 [Homalodisca vitripennis]|nr:hypothetical protein J6590_026990 [Homalodisca vitripennis]